MHEQLKSYQGAKIVVELANGKQLAGTVAAVNQQDIRMETDEGICLIPISAIQIIWESQNRSPAEENINDSGMPCMQSYAKPCFFAYAQPCCQPFCQPCIECYARPCPQSFTPSPCPDPCYERYAYFEHHCFERYFAHHHPAPYPPYPYPPYPYPPYPYPPYPFGGDPGPGEASQSQASAADSKAEDKKDVKE